MGREIDFKHGLGDSQRMQWDQFKKHCGIILWSKMSLIKIHLKFQQFEVAQPPVLTSLHAEEHGCNSCNSSQLFLQGLETVNTDAGR